jgi:adenylate kinase family enzyme
MNVEFPVFKTKIDGLDTKFDVTDPAQRKEYFQAKAGAEIQKIQNFLNSGNTFIAYLLGKKNSGKGTYSKIFSEIFGMDKFIHISIGDLVRQNNTDLLDDSKKQNKLDELKKYYRGYISFEEAIDTLLGRSTSNLLPTELVLAMVKAEIARNPKKAIFIDGFPRKLDQISYSLYFRDLINYREDPDFFILIDLPNTIIDARIKGRVICPICHTPRNINLLRTKTIGHDKDTNKFYLICDNPDCAGYDKEKMVSKEGDELGIEAIKDRIAGDEELIEKAFTIHGVEKVLLRNSVPVDKKDFVDDYELTPEYVYSADDNGEIKVTEKLWSIPDDKGVESYSLMPAPVVVSMLKQIVSVLKL